MQLQRQILKNFDEIRSKIRKYLNARLNEKEYLEKALILKSRPTVYVLGITNICQLECPLCATGARLDANRSSGYMEYELAERIIDKIKDHAQAIWLHNWGESLLHKDFIRILNKVKECNIPVQVSSNLSFPYKEELFRNIIRAPLDKLIVSLDGLRQETYEKYRKGGNLALILENVRQINRIKKEFNIKYPKIIFQFLVNKFNSHEVPELKSRYRELGGDGYFISELCMPFSYSDVLSAKEWLTDEDISKRDFLDVDLWTLNKVCPFLYKFMVFEVDGGILPCCYLYNKKDDFGLFDNNKAVEEMYNTKAFVAARKLFRDPQNIETKTICRVCSVFKSYQQEVGRTVR